MPPPKTAKQWLTVKEAAAHARCSPTIISRAAQKGLLSGVKLTPDTPKSKWLFTTEDVDRWLEAGRVGSSVKRRAS